MLKNLRNQKGFTLIELLIVIVIIGILAGVVIAVINPAQQQRKASEAVLRANTDKLCTAMIACLSATTDTTKCDTVLEIGQSPDGNPTGSSYVIDSSNPAAWAVQGKASVAANACTFQCTYDTTDGSSTAVVPVTPDNCLIQ